MMFFAFKLLTLLTVIHSTIAEQSRVYYGQDVVPAAFDEYAQPISRSNGEFPYMVSILHDGSHNCGGAILTYDVILTAGHCVEAMKPIRIAVKAGHVARNDKSTNAQVLPIKFYEIHPKYNGFAYDIALVKLDGAFVPSTYVQPIQLAHKKDNYYGQKGTIIGWGKTQSGYGAEFLQRANIEIIPDDECAYRKLTDSLSESEICGLDRERELSGICNGDSGGPFVIHYPNNQFKDVLIGLSSHGAVSEDGIGCKTKSPSVFANIAYLEDWIMDTYYTKFS